MINKRSGHQHVYSAGTQNAKFRDIRQHEYYILRLFKLFLLAIELSEFFVSSNYSYKMLLQYFSFNKITLG
jgi:hypothetical protein